MAYDPTTTNQSGKAGLVIQYEKLPDHLRRTHDWPERYGLSGQPEYIPTMVFSPAALAKAREKLGPRWPLSDPELEPAVVCCLPAEETAGSVISEAMSALMNIGALLNLPPTWETVEDLKRAVLRTISDLQMQVKVAQLPIRVTVPAGEEHVRVLRVVEYTGPRKLVEEQVRRSLHGTRAGYGGTDGPAVAITAVTLNEFPEVLIAAREVDGTQPYRTQAARHIALDTPAPAVAQSPAPAPDAPAPPAPEKESAVAEAPDAVSDDTTQF